MNRKIVFMALVAAAPLSVSGCQNDSAVASAVESAATATRQIAKPPAALRAVEEELFEGVADSRAKSWDAFLSSVSKDERTYLEGLSQRYFGALHFSTAAERSELISLGHRFLKSGLLPSMLATLTYEQWPTTTIERPVYYL